MTLTFKKRQSPRGNTAVQPVDSMLKMAENRGSMHLSRTMKYAHNPVLVSVPLEQTPLTRE